MSATDTEVVIYGPTISTYGRIVAVAAEEAGASWRNVPTPAGSKLNRQQHPFLKTPAVEVGGDLLYESVAICQLIDDRYNAGALQPDDALERARMAQWISVANAYVFPTSEHGLVIPRLILPAMGQPPRPDIVERSIREIAYQLTVVSLRLQQAEYLAGSRFSLADVFMACCVIPISMTPEGARVLSQLLDLSRWFDTVCSRGSIEATRWPDEAERPTSVP